MIRHAWHFYYALVLVIKVVCGSIVLRASHLNWALYACTKQRSRHLNETKQFACLRVSFGFLISG
ncbi:DUF3265 domain-containing protein [Vibrio parahaemolyticus]|nr:DUF3265 domain-containing protein [Vibrio parahaemolyticus]TOK51803.1 DUF3265 domain-containing protein [Vibrio parahaemolyticus]TOQ36803.1 DUF3265 domain-containing protein [Vibrio parahaemolyticus]TOQ56275.1 DUF3265 domain-containing protein [Vibrio parahaemolyticus]